MANIILVRKVWEVIAEVSIASKVSRHHCACSSFPTYASESNAKLHINHMPGLCMVWGTHDHVLHDFFSPKVIAWPTCNERCASFGETLDIPGLGFGLAAEVSYSLIVKTG